MPRTFRWVFQPGSEETPAATFLIRLAVGGVFFVSGAVKFLYANQGAGRFTKLGIPEPEITAYLVGAVEIAAALLLVAGLFTRMAAFPLVIDMLVAIGTSKLGLLFGPGPEPVAASPKTGFWAFAYQGRLDGTMLLCCLFLVAAGAGVWSVDAWRSRRKGTKIRAVAGDRDRLTRELLLDELRGGPHSPRV